MEVVTYVVKFVYDYFRSVKEDILGNTDDIRDDDSLDLEADPTEATRLMKPDSVDITEQEVSNSTGRQKKAIAHTDGEQHQMHRPTMKVLIFC